MSNKVSSELVDTSDKSLEKKADEFYKSIKFHKLNTILDKFVSSDKHLISKFISKYPILAIYFLDLLPESKATKLLKDIDDEAIIYMIEEEIRIILLNKFSTAEDPELVLSISRLIDFVGDRENPRYPTDEDIRLLELLYEEKKQKGAKSRFNFLNFIPMKRAVELAKRMVSLNPSALTIMFLLISDDLRNSIIDNAGEDMLEVLKYFPLEVIRDFLVYSRENTSKAIEFLKGVERTKEFVEDVERLLDKRFKALKYLEEIKKLKGEYIRANISKNEFYNGIYKLLRNMNDNERELFLKELLYRGILSEKDMNFFLKFFEAQKL